MVLRIANVATSMYCYLPGLWVLPSPMRRQLYRSGGGVNGAAERGMLKRRGEQKYEQTIQEAQGGPSRGRASGATIYKTPPVRREGVRA